MPLVGNLGGGAIGKGIQLHLAEFGVQIAERASKWIPGADKLSAGWKRIGLGVLAPWLLKKLRVPSQFADTFGAVAVAQGLYFFTQNLRTSFLEKAGLGDYVTSLDGMDYDESLSDAGYGLLGFGGAIEPDDSGALNDYVTEYA